VYTYTITSNTFYVTKKQREVEFMVRSGMLSKRDAARKLKIHHNNVDCKLYNILKEKLQEHNINL